MGDLEVDGAARFAAGGNRDQHGGTGVSRDGQI